MAEQTILSWNLPNWITVVLMVLVAMLVLGTLSQVIKTRAGKTEASA